MVFVPADRRADRWLRAILATPPTITIGPAAVAVQAASTGDDPADLWGRLHAAGAKNLLK